VVLFAGCEKESFDHQQPQPDSGNRQPVAVRFSSDFSTQIWSATGLQTRASGTTWSRNDTIGIYMTTFGSADTVVNNYGNKPYYISLIDSSFFFPADDNIMFYPDSGIVNFIAYYPYKSSIRTDSVDIYDVDVSVQTNIENHDLLWADASTSKLSGYSRADSLEQVVLRFSHKLSKLEINVIKGIEFPDIDSVFIKGLTTKGAFDLKTGSLALVASDSVFIPVTLPNEKYEAVVIPQSADSLRMDFFIGDSTFVYKDTVPMSFDTGKKYIYNIKITR
jgi:hypothetical protein